MTTRPAISHRKPGGPAAGDCRYPGSGTPGVGSASRCLTPCCSSPSTSRSCSLTLHIATSWSVHRDLRRHPAGPGVRAAQGSAAMALIPTLQRREVAATTPPSSLRPRSVNSSCAHDSWSSSNRRRTGCGHHAPGAGSRRTRPATTAVGARSRGPGAGADYLLDLLRATVVFPGLSAARSGRPRRAQRRRPLQHFRLAGPRAT